MSVEAKDTLNIQKKCISKKNMHVFLRQ